MDTSFLGQLNFMAFQILGHGEFNDSNGLTCGAFIFQWDS